jgi:hypothetical protein
MAKTGPGDKYTDYGNYPSYSAQRLDGKGITGTR